VPVPFQLAAAESTDLFVGTQDAPRQVLRVTLSRTLVEPIRLSVHGDEVSGTAMVPAGVGVVAVEVGLDLPDVPAGNTVPVTVTVGDTSLDTTVTVEKPGDTMYLVSHFHYDPVWWNSASSPAELAVGGRAAVGGLAGVAAPPRPWERNGFALVDAHIDLALRDPDYTFVLAEIDYLKPYLDTNPERKADLRKLLAEGRVELVGGTYTEPSTNLSCAETTIRNIVYGIGYQRDILRGEPTTAWQLDVFGHDPQLPGYLADAGLTGTAWARGPYHQWGPVQKNFGMARADASAMQFPSEFEWIAPSGRGVLTHYMPNHYSAGWWMDSAATLPEAEIAVYAMYRILKPVAATRHLMLPVGTDYAPPNK
jgi:alpha-mannosidase